MRHLTAPGDPGNEKLREAINRTHQRGVPPKNPKTFLWGQDVASHDKGGVFNLTKGLMQEFGNDRVLQRAPSPRTTSSAPPTDMSRV